MGAQQLALPNGEPDSSDTLPALTARQTIALQALVQGKSHQEAAAAARVHRNTVANWRYNSEVFQAHLVVAQRMLWGQVIHRLHNEALASVAFLAKLRDNDYASNTDRARAAIAILKHAQWPNSAARPTMATDRQFTIVQNAYGTHGTESLADLESHLFLENMLFRPDDRRKRIADLAMAAQEAEAAVQQHEDRLRCLHGAQTGEEKREALQVRGKLEEAKRQLAKARGRQAWEQARLAEFEQEVQHVASQFIEVPHQDASNSTEN